jgi:CRP-like cAMP-binding protein
VPGESRPDLVASTLLRRLERLVAFDEADRDAIVQSLSDIRTVRPRADILREDDRIDGLIVVLEGFSYSYKLLPDGRRQLLGFLIPSDFCDLGLFIRERMDHSVAAIAPTTVGSIGRDRLLDLVETHPRVARAMWWSSLVEQAVLREWLVNVGQRTAIERVSHLLCELYFRFEAAGLATDGRFELPLTQAELGDTLGLSTVHINRTLRDLRGQGLIETNGKFYQIRDRDRLARIGVFNPAYLTVGRDLLDGRVPRG